LCDTAADLALIDGPLMCHSNYYIIWL